MGGGEAVCSQNREGNKGQTCGGRHDGTIVNVYMPGVNGVTDCHPSVLSKASAQKAGFKGALLCADAGTRVQSGTGAHASTRAHTHTEGPSLSAPLSLRSEYEQKTHPLKQRQVKVLQ